MNIPVIKAVDGFIGRLLTTMLPSPPCADIRKKPHSILLIRPGGIGDAVLLAPAISVLKEQCPGVIITVLAERRNAGVMDLIPAVDHLYCYDALAQLLRAVGGRYDLVIDTEQSHRLSAVVARVICAPVKIGFATNERQRMFTHAVPYSHDDYEPLSFFRLLLAAGIEQKHCSVHSPFLKIPPAAQAKGEQMLSSLQGKQFVTLFAGASIPERRWGAGRFRCLAEELMQKGYGIVVVGDASDGPDGELIVASGGLNLTGKTSLAETAAVIARSLLLVSGDSGMLHIAVGLGIPTVSLFGPGRALKWAPRGEKNIVLNKQLDCSPCTTFGTTPCCMQEARCMQEITLAEVSEAAIRLLNK